MLLSLKVIDIQINIQLLRALGYIRYCTKVLKQPSCPHILPGKREREMAINDVSLSQAACKKVPKDTK